MNPEPFPSQLGWIEQNKPRLNQKKSYAKKGKCLPTYLRTFCNWGLGFYTFGGATLRGVSANLTGSLSWIKCILTKVLPSIIRLVSKIACTQKPYFQYRFIEMYLSLLLSTHVKVIRITNHSFAKKNPPTTTLCSDNTNTYHCPWKASILTWYLEVHLIREHFCKLPSGNHFFEICSFIVVAETMM